jgi:hypothetical protein
MFSQFNKKVERFIAQRAAEGLNRKILKYVLKCDLKLEKFQKELRAPLKTRARELQNH